MPRPPRPIDTEKRLVGFVASPQELTVLRAEATRLGLSLASLLRMLVRERFSLELSRER